MVKEFPTTGNDLANLASQIEEAKKNEQNSPAKINNLSPEEAAKLATETAEANEILKNDANKIEAKDATKIEHAVEAIQENTQPLDKFSKDPSVSDLDRSKAEKSLFVAADQEKKIRISRSEAIASKAQKFADGVETAVLNQARAEGYTVDFFADSSEDEIKQEMAYLKKTGDDKNYIIAEKALGLKNPRYAKKETVIQMPQYTESNAAHPNNKEAQVTKKETPTSDSGPKVIQMPQYTESNAAHPNNKEAQVTEKTETKSDPKMDAIRQKIQEQRAAKEQEKLRKSKESNQLSKGQQILAEIDALKKDPYSSPSMITRAEGKMRRMIASGEIDSLEAEILIQDAGKGKVEKNLGIFAGKLSEMNRKYLKNTTYGRVMEWSRTGNKYQKFAKRVLVSGGIGAVVGLAGSAIGTAAVTAGAATLVGAGYSAARAGFSAIAGGAAGEIHKIATKKGLNADLESIKNKRDQELLTKKATFTESGARLNGQELLRLRSLRSLSKKQALGNFELAQLQALESRYTAYEKVRNTQFDRTRDNYKELVSRRNNKNDKNRMYVAGAAGLLTGITAGVMGGRDLVEAGISGDPKIPVQELDEVVIKGSPKNPFIDGVPQNPDLVEFTEPTFDDVPHMAKVANGDGISQILKRQLDANPELAAKFGIKTGSPAEYSELMERLGYKSGNMEVRLKGGDLHIGRDAYMVGTNMDGDPVVYEFKNGATHPVEHQCVGGEQLEGSFGNNDQLESNEYLFDATKVQSAENTYTQPDTYTQNNFDQNLFENDQPGTSTQNNFDQSLFEDAQPSAENTPAGGVDQSVFGQASENTPASDIETGTEPSPTVADDTPETPPKTQAELRHERIMERKRLRQERIVAREQARIERLRSGRKTWLGRNWGFLAAGAAVIADVAEDGKLDAFGIFDRPRGGGIITGEPTTIPSPERPPVNLPPEDGGGNDGPGYRRGNNTEGAGGGTNTSPNTPSGNGGGNGSGPGFRGGNN